MRFSSLGRGGFFACALAILGVAVSPLAGCGLECTQVGCDSGVSALVHLDAPATTVAEGAVQVCHQNVCRAVHATAMTGRSTSWSLNGGQVRGELEAEGSGSLVRVFMALDGSAEAKDGDRVQIRVTDAAGAVLAEHSRPVRYESSNPNGAACGPTCHVAAVELWPASASDVSCPSTTCEAGFDASTTVKAAPELTGLTTLKVCRNDECKTAEVHLFANEVGGPSATSNGSFVVGELGAHPWSATYFSKDRGLELHVHVEADTRDLRNGDRYRIDWRAAETGAPVLVLDQTATYDEAQPGGPACSPTPCRSQTVVVP